MKRKKGFLYNSVDVDVTEMRIGNSHVQYPKFRSIMLPSECVYFENVNQLVRHNQIHPHQRPNVGSSLAAE